MLNVTYYNIDNKIFLKRLNERSTRTDVIGAHLKRAISDGR